MRLVHTRLTGFPASLFSVMGINYVIYNHKPGIEWVISGKWDVCFV